MIEMFFLALFVGFIYYLMLFSLTRELKLINTKKYNFSRMAIASFFASSLLQLLTILFTLLVLKFSVINYFYSVQTSISTFLSAFLISRIFQLETTKVALKFALVMMALDVIVQIILKPGFETLLAILI